jgi:hypothetical protein
MLRRLQALIITEKSTLGEILNKHATGIFFRMTVLRPYSVTS